MRDIAKSGRNVRMRLEEKNKMKEEDKQNQEEEERRKSVGGVG